MSFGIKLWKDEEAQENEQSPSVAPSVCMSIEKRHVVSAVASV